MKQIITKMQEQFAREGVTAEVTFISATMFSVLVDDAAQFARAKEIMRAANQQLDSEAMDDECGHCAYYKF